ncbi:MAG: hypothetical protein Kow0063_23230 [Anaerolineae bacterium]
MKSHLIVIDEAGKMKCFSSRFRELVVAAIESDLAVLATVALSGGRFIEGLKARPDVILLPVTRENRDRLVDQVAGWTEEILAGV